MGSIIVCPLASIAEIAVRHRATDMVSLIANGQDFHRPGVIRAERHLTLRMNDIAFAGTGDLVAPSEDHVAQLIGFAQSWDRAAPLVVHCWMGVSRSPAAALIVALALHPDQDEVALATRLRAVAPHATPNARLIEIGDRALGRNGRLSAAIKSIGRGAETDGRASFVLPLTA
ncbi:tyrosine phosphatase family protein [Rhizobium sp. SSA_523]|uniref:tyrosine phosphatase family protein n=1 Tax=Rhizobium sp. SSA_523 TaxID=2952477 RepID=UPI002090E6D7|nr:tyrosine phosphatase family protein [Rhizobium sp. SSA_523]MCO5730816.1 tyrosine phosphatase family protein [Rhizobium sp. SSA_523]WKC24362.1 tyrosine phosphatase family protein [Rhizobium sp. SSA_523]